LTDWIANLLERFLGWTLGGLCVVPGVQVCLLGKGSIIGDMSVNEHGATGPPRRSATVVALTELLTYKVPLKEFKRRMPAEVLEVSRGLPGVLMPLSE
jgi:CRP-like cAMP-binding protein